LPAALAIIKPSASKKMVVLASSNRVDRFASVMVNLGKVTLKNSNSVIGLFLLVILVGLLATTRLTVDEDRIATFHKSEALFQADKSINQFFDGTYNLDIVVEASEAEALFEPEKLRKIEALQDYALSLQNVNGANSIVDYLKQMNRSLNGGSPKDYQLPQDQALIAQYFLIYSASSDPTDFEEEIDYDYRVANIRLNLNEGSYQQTKHIVEDLETYIAEQFQGNDLSATLSGRVTVNYHWIKDLGESHFVGLALSLFLVWTVSSILFGSITAGTFAIIPVVTSILLVYSAMVALGIKLGIGTSMFASVAIGLGVDFAIHTIDRLRSLFVENKGDWDAALTQLYPSTGRALFFNYLAITLGFAVLISSKVVPLTNFGTIVVVSVTVSFLASLSLLPALFNVIKPSFISDSLNNSEQLPQLSMARKWLRISSFIIVTGLLGSLLISNQSLAAEDSSVIPTDAMTIVNNINQVDDGEHVKRNLTMTLIDKRGKTRVRETRTFRKYYEGEKRTILFYQRPSNVKGTAFLTLDYKQADRDDNQWLYLPALRKVRRISVSDRGDYFLGTDFTYEDIKLEGKLDIEDYNFEIIKTEVLNFEDGLSYQSIKMNGIPKSRAIAKELGYGRTEFWVDTKTWLIIKADYWDQKGKLLKTLINADIRAIDDILTRHKLTIDNHKTGHKTIFEFSEVDYQSPVKDTLFSKRAMKQGK
jgi:hypothetical protein